MNQLQQQVVKRQIHDLFRQVQALQLELSDLRFEEARILGVLEKKAEVLAAMAEGLNIPVPTVQDVLTSIPDSKAEERKPAPLFSIRAKE